MDETQRLLASPAGEQWEIIGPRNHHGITTALFSLKTKESSGIGEYLDLIPLMQWCKEVGFDVIQLLPLNDTGLDKGPYGAISAFALNPIHLSLTHLQHIEEFPELTTMLLDFRHLSESQRIEYAKVQAAKNCFLHKYYLLAGKAIKESESYQQFVKSHSWLSSYALFKAIKIERNWESWEKWEDLSSPSPQTLKKASEYYESEISFHIFIQYLCFQQMESVKKQADSLGIFIKGDIPILISRESADVWIHRSLFLMDLSAGAPPDMYSKEGQNWGFPIYNWAEMAKEGYIWWKQRLEVASRLYHLYRIDHIVGFFRIWSIPLGKEGHEGYFVPEARETWLTHGSEIMKIMLKNSSLLPIGEDLGTVPPEVRACLNGLGICGTKVIRWERLWNVEGQPFIKYDEYIPASMTTVSTHDSEPLQMWWENFPKEARDFAAFKGWNYTFELSKNRHQEILWDSHHTSSLFHINLLQEYLALVPGLTWPNLDDERINTPGTISERNWSYRYRASMEEIAANEPLRKVIREVIS